jgi:hypothetical protein
LVEDELMELSDWPAGDAGDEVGLSVLSPDDLLELSD